MLNGLKIVAVAIVAQAVWGMARNLCPDKERATIAVAAIAVLAIVPGPLGMVGAIGLGALVGLLAVFLPGFLLLVGVLSFWDRFRAMAPAQSMMQGANAAVVGILGATLYAPAFTSAIGDLRDFTLALFCCVLLMAWKAPPWVVVIVAAAGGAGLAMLA